MAHVPYFGSDMLYMVLLCNTVYVYFTNYTFSNFMKIKSKMNICVSDVSKMPFKRKCVTEMFHEEWQCSSTDQLETKVYGPLRAKLLQLAGKEDIRRYFSKSLPRFCTSCISKVQSLYFSTNSLDEEPPDTLPIDPPDTLSSTSGASVSSSSDEEECATAAKLRKIDTHEPPIKHAKISVVELTDDEKKQLAYDLGRNEANSLKDYALSLSRDKSLQSLLSLNIKDAHDACSSTVTAFLSGIQETPLMPLEGDRNRKKYLYKIYKSVENVLNLTGLKLTLPAHFRESVLLYTLTGSKLALRILGSGGAHASYQSVKAWLAGLSSQTQAVPSGDVIATFDNNQVLQRRWKVKLRNEVKCNIVTVIAFFKISSEGILQTQCELKPCNWSLRDIDNHQIERIKYIDKAEDIKETHYTHLHTFLAEEIKIVVEEQNNIATTYCDVIDEKVKKKVMNEKYKKCYNCQFEEIPKTKHTCPKCKVSVTKGKMKSMGLDANGMVDESIDENRTNYPPKKESRVFVQPCSAGRQSFNLAYEMLGEDHCAYQSYEHLAPEIRNIPTVHVREPVYVNPCSYAAVATVLRNIGLKAGLKKHGGDREWVIIVCDGVPYNLCHRVVNSMHTCSACDVSLNGKDECAEHHNTDHINDEDVHFEQEFGWVLLRPGSGHIEMNMVKGIVELCWEVFWKELVICFNFRSEAAQKSAKKVNDHHKGWTLLRIARHSVTRELILPYVRTELEKKEQDLSVKGFMKFVMNAKDPNYTFMCDMTFELIDAIFMYRAGVRLHINKFIEAGRAKFAKLWCGRNHPLYRELEMTDILMTTRMPPEIRDLVLDTDSLNLSGVKGTGEGADFRLEEVNKRVQQWLPNVPAAKDWKIACCNFDNLEKFRDTVFEQMDLADPKLHRKHSVQRIDDEIIAFRLKLDQKTIFHNPAFCEIMCP